MDRRGASVRQPNSQQLSLRRTLGAWPREALTGIARGTVETSLASPPRNGTWSVTLRPSLVGEGLGLRFRFSMDLRQQDLARRVRGRVELAEEASNFGLLRIHESGARIVVRGCPQFLVSRD